MKLSLRTCYLQTNACMHVLTVLLCILCADTVDPSSNPRDFGIVIDAGSSGSRIYVYAWAAGFQHGSLPDITEVFQHKIKPGVSSFVGDSAGLQTHITQLIESCEAAVPKYLHAKTPIYLMATGGESMHAHVHKPTHTHHTYIPTEHTHTYRHTSIPLTR